MTNWTILESINQKVLSELRLENVGNLSDSRFFIFPYSIIPDLLKESITFLNNKMFWDFTKQEMNLDFYKMEDDFFYLDEFDMSEGINANSIINIFYNDYDNSRKIILKRKYYKDYLQFKSTNNYFIKSNPDSYVIKNNKIYLYPNPDKDYNLKIEIFSQIPKVLSENENISFIEEETMQNSIYNYINFIILALLNRDNATQYLNKSLLGRSQLIKLNNNAFTPFQTRSKFQWF